MRKSSFNRKLIRDVNPPDLEPLTSSVRVRKIRFKDEVSSPIHTYRQPTFASRESIFNRPAASNDLEQRRKNFEEFKKVYGERLKRQSTDVVPIQKSRSGSILKFSRLSKDPKHVDIVNIQMPPKMGSGSAIISVQNDLANKKVIKMVSQSILTENIPKKVEHFSVEVNLEKVEKNKPEATVLSSTNEQNLPKAVDNTKTEEKRRYKAPKTLPKLAIKKRVSHSPRGKDKIWCALANINDKLQKMHQKYFETPKVKFKSVNDSFTQSANIEVLFDNKNKVSNGGESDHKTFEYPKIKDTLTEIEAHLERIANMDLASSGGSVKPEISVVETYNGRFEGGVPNLEANSTLNSQKTEETANEIVKDFQMRKMKAVRHDIASVEDLLEKISHITESESKFSLDSLNNSREEVRYNLNNLKNVEGFLKPSSKIRREFRNASSGLTPQRGQSIRDYTNSNYSGPNSKTQQTKNLSESEDEEVPTSIKKSFYLSREFDPKNSKIKVFREDRYSIFPKFNPKNKYGSQESISKLIENLKSTMGNSFYSPVCPGSKK